MLGIARVVGYLLITAGIMGCDYVRKLDNCNIKPQTIPVYFSGIAGAEGTMVIKRSASSSDSMVMRVSLYDPRVSSTGYSERAPIVEMVASGQCKGNILRAQIESSLDEGSPFRVLGGEMISVIDDSGSDSVFGHWSATLLAVENLFQENDADMGLKGKPYKGFWLSLETSRK